MDRNAGPASPESAHHHGPATGLSGERRVLHSPHGRIQWRRCQKTKLTASLKEKEYRIAEERWMIY